MDTEETLATNAVTFVANPLAVGLSRALVRTSLIRWGYRELVDDAEMVVSELATNAVHATNAYEPDWWVNSVPPPALIRVQIAYYVGRVVIGVWDRSPAEPKQGSADEAEESGRGLVIVEALSTRWGWDTVHPYSGYKGKVVWAELPLPPLPIRVPDPPEYVVHAEVGEIRLLRRVRDSLRNI